MLFFRIIQASWTAWILFILFSILLNEGHLFTNSPNQGYFCSFTCSEEWPSSSSNFYLPEAITCALQSHNANSIFLVPCYVSITRFSVQMYRYCTVKITHAKIFHWLWDIFCNKFPVLVQLLIFVQNMLPSWTPNCLARLPPAKMHTENELTWAESSCAPVSGKPLKSTLEMNANSSTSFWETRWPRQHPHMPRYIIQRLVWSCSKLQSTIH